MNDRVTVYCDGAKALTLTPNDHVATGGEGSVYVKGNFAYKVFTDPAKALRAGMERKVEFLRKLQHPGIAAPDAVLRSKAGEFLGIRLPRVVGDPLCKAFTNTWRDAHQFGLAETAKVVDAMREVTAFAHRNNALLVDANELNWMLHGTTPVAIDVDSWQLPGFPATAIMASIKDYAEPGFSEGTDWFAWAITSFQLWCGIHPYKGVHPSFARGVLEERMRKNASVFDAGVKLPGAARPADDIPAMLRNWYRDVFVGGARSAPPSAFASALVTQTAPKLRIKQVLAGSLKLERLGNAGERVVAAFNGFVVARSGKTLVAWDALSKSALPNLTEAALQDVLLQRAALVRAGQSRILVRLDLAQGVEALDLTTGSRASLPSAATKLWVSGNRLFALVPGVSDGVVELEAAPLGDRLVLSVRHQWRFATLSTSFFRGIAVQDCLGTPFVGVLESDGVVMGAAPWLKDYRVIDGFAVDRSSAWLTAVRVRDGETVRLALTFHGSVFQCSEEILVADTHLDAAATVAGVAVLKFGDQLVVAKGSSRKVVDNAGVSAGFRLFSLGAGIGGFEDGEVSRLSLT